MSAGFNQKDWEWAFDSDTNRIYYVNHRLQTTQWLNPMDQLTKPASFAECVGDQLPYGWEKIDDPKIGVYYSNHLEQKNQFEDPRIEWQRKRWQMLTNYLRRANIKNSAATANRKQIKLDESHDEIMEVMDRWFKKGSRNSVEV